MFDVYFVLSVGQVMGFSAEQVSGFVALIGILSMIAQVCCEMFNIEDILSQKVTFYANTTDKRL